jgi:hypothetical protein
VSLRSTFAFLQRDAVLCIRAETCSDWLSACAHTGEVAPEVAPAEGGAQAPEAGSVPIVTSEGPAGDLSGYAQPAAVVNSDVQVLNLKASA